MARIRTIKPELPHSESMGRVSRDARLTFILMWTLADDSGRLRGNSRMLASLLYPYDDDASGLIEGWLTELEREGCIARYSPDGTSYIEIRNWLKHQKIDKPSASKLPAFDESSRKVANPLEPSSEDLDLDQGSRIKDQRNIAARPSRVSKPVSRETEPEWFLEFKLAYPERAGGDYNWRGALKAANARMTEGHTPREFIEGATRYKLYVKATGSANTEWVKQASTFLGPDKHFLTPWTVPAEKQGPDATKTATRDAAAWAEAKSYAQSIGFRGPHPAETPTSYMQQAKRYAEDVKPSCKVDTSAIVRKLTGAAA
jgi:hypothetical protein